MPRIRSLVTTVRIDVAQRAHDCQANGNHRLSKGDRRLGVKKDRSWDNYCLDCGRRILEGDAAKIASLLRAINGDGLVAGDEG
ncbi:hypothetical protein J2X48_005138 [Bosea sp. BE271]|jgi:hypothetical protein|uniref:hypothetical protein n=1 Tax=Bosea TaxID=85413 RepID=UPI00286321C9|nr:MULTISPECIES: hypothetical protein [Bosea]MDR6831409.1 hypothetical protein [Bosea robiniae]MDR6898167.1 hypothetical protein [Bosea sp. BE109]MDR7141545.1 hypothetical protein [Bosea sp. BE168]MDR7178187.1 hypothetical protein [Bosea sp. BE271]